MFKILVCDNDLTYLTTTKLQRFRIDVASCEDDILNLTFSTNYNLFIANIYYYKLFRELKDSLQEPNIIFTDEYYNIQNVKKAYEVGDNYVLKPIYFEELEIKINYFYKKIYTNTADIINYKDLFFHTTLNHLYKNNQKIKLSPNEAKLVYIFLLNISKPVSKDMILEELQTSDGTLRVYISKLKKIGFELHYERVNLAYTLVV